MSASQVNLTDPKVEFIYAGNRIDCWSCGVVYWMTAEYEQRRRDDHRTFWCPNGHQTVFKGETDAEKYKRLHKDAADRAARAIAERDQAEASRRAWKGQATRARNKVLAGNCPFCGQHLRDLERHVSRQHADEAAKPETEPTA